MAPTLRTARSSLIGGVSQQPEAVRLESQCEAQDDAYPSIVDGLMKRQPVEHLRNISVSIPQNMRLGTHVHWINLSPSERYIVWISTFAGVAADIRIFDAADGTEMTVTGQNGGPIGVAANYLVPATDGRRNLEFLTLRDTTYIVNKDVTVEMTSLLSDSVDVDPGAGQDFRSNSRFRVFYFIRSTAYLRTWRVRMWLTNDSGVVSPPNTTLAEKELNIARVKTHDGTFGANKNGSPNHEPPYQSPNLLAGFQIASIEPHDVGRELYRGAKQSGTGGPPTSTFNGGIEARWNDLVLSKPLKDILVMGVSSLNEPPQNSGVVMLEIASRDKTSPNFYADIDLEEIQQSGGADGDLVIFGDTIQRFTDLPLVCRHGHVIKITGDPDGGVGEHYVEFVEDPETNTVGKLLAQGAWKESRASLSQYRIDNSTMPHKIVRVVDASSPNGFRFEVYAETWDDMEVGDDLSNPQPSFVGRQINSMFFWKNRLGFISGGNLIFSEAAVFTNFWRTTVTTLVDSDPIDVNIGAREGGVPRFAVPMQGSLVVFADEQQFAVLGEPLLSPSTISVTPVSAFDTYFDVLPVATEVGIFFGFPGTASKFSQVRELRRIGDSERYDDFQVTAHVPRYIRGRIREMAANPVDNLLVVRTDDEESSHLLYIYKWFDLGNERAQSAWFRYRLGVNEPATLTGLLAGFETTRAVQVMGMNFFDNALYLFMAYTHAASQTMEYAIEKIEFADQHQDPFPFNENDPTNRGAAQSVYHTLIDRRVTENECVLSYDYSDRTVRIELPYRIARGDSGGQGVPVVVTRINSNTGGANGAAVAEGRQYPVETVLQATSAGGVFVTVLKVSDPDRELYQALGSPTAGSPPVQSAGDRAVRLFIGFQYEKDYVFSQFGLKEQRPDGRRGNIMTGRWQLLYGTVVFEQSGFLLVEVAPATRPSDGAPIVNRPVFRYPAAMMTVGEGEDYLGDPNIRDGILRFPLMTAPRLVRVSIKNDSPFPSNVKSAEIEGTFSSRSILHTQ